MDRTDEPSKWVCRLTIVFPGEKDRRSGSGFLVNIPFTQKYCIMTAGHNIVLPGKGKAESVTVDFPQKLSFVAEAPELFVSSVYAASPTESEADASSVDDYGLIAVDRSRLTITPEQDIRGCALHVLPSQTKLHNTGAVVHGYMGGDKNQSRMTSSLVYPIKARVLKYGTNTTEGISGGPVFVNYNEREVAVGIHNYSGRATRITIPVMLEMLSWIQDYRVDRTFEDYFRKGIYLQTTSGPAPNLVGRPSFLGQSPRAVFQLVPVFIAKETPKSRQRKNNDHQHSFIILSSIDQQSQSKRHLFVTVEKGSSGGYVCLKEASGPRDDNSFSLWGEREIKRLALTTDSEVMLSIKSTGRAHCECGCITKDDAVVMTDPSPGSTRPTWFDITKGPSRSHASGDRE